MFEIIDGPEELQIHEFELKSGESIGRKNTNKICFAEDLHMSNLHSKINLVHDVFYFEDIASTNGSWIRLSEENHES